MKSEGFCKLCNVIFCRDTKKQIFCSHKCAANWGNLKRKKNSLKGRVCKYCNKLATINNFFVKYCKECSKKNIKSKFNNLAKQLKRSFNLHFIETIFSKEKFKYADKIIDYPDSPTGRAYIGLAKLPLMKNDNGIGFKGVKVQSENRALIQCSNCSMWLTKLAAAHLQKCGGLTTREYKEKFSLNLHSGLISDVTGNKMSVLAEKLLATNKFNRGYNGKRKFLKGRKPSMETLDKWGTCPEQLRDRLFEYINRFKRIPNGSPREGISVPTYKYRFGSFNNALKHYKLPTRTQFGAYVLYEFQDGTIYKIQKHYFDYEKFYKLLIQKCPQLSNYNLVTP